jgi:hypothetical protein
MKRLIILLSLVIERAVLAALFQFIRILVFNLKTKKGILIILSLAIFLLFSVNLNDNSIFLENFLLP